MARYLLDTGIVIRHLRGRGDIVRLMRALGRTGRLGISAVTRLEIRAGMHPEEEHLTDRLLSRLLVYDVDTRIADRAGEYLRKRDPGLNVPDAIIGATAATHMLTLVTLNRKHFSGLRLSLYPLSL